MSRRLYFVLPDVETSQKLQQDLLLSRIEERRMHFLARRGTDMKDLPEATPLQKTDLMRGLLIGLFAGAITGLLAGFYIYFNPDSVGLQIPPFVIFICALVAAVVGAWISGLLIGASTPNARLEAYQDQIRKGNILLILDVPTRRVEEIRKIVRQHHPAAEDHGADPTVPAFP